jgi:thiamine biosynthesis lipoprotein
MGRTILLLMLGLLSGCGQSFSRTEHGRILMGTRARIVMYAADEGLATEAVAAAFARIEHLEAILSDWRLESEVTRLRTALDGVWNPISPDLDHALRVSMGVWRDTGGAFDPACGRMSSSWRAARARGEPPLEWTEMMGDAGPPADRVQHRPGEVRFRAPVPWLDFGGIGKGLAADAAAETIRTFGIDSVLVDIGGDLAIGAAPPGKVGWTVRVVAHEVPLMLVECGVATSGSGEQHLAGRSHIIDPRTGRWMRRHEDVTVLAPSAALADALASAGCVMGAAGLRQVVSDQEGVTVVTSDLSKSESARQVGSTE